MPKTLKKYGSKYKYASKSSALQRELADSSSNADTDNDTLPAAVSRKLPKNVGGNAGSATSHTVTAVDSDVNGDSAPNALCHPRMVVEISHSSSSHMGLPIHKTPPSIPSHQSTPHMGPVSIAPNSDDGSPPVAGGIHPDLPPAEQNDVQDHANASSDSEDYHGGWFTNDQIIWARSKCIDFFRELDAKAREWKRSPESVRCKIGR